MFEYNLPKELIANAPVEPRDSAKLFVYSTKTDEIVLDTFSNIARYLPRGSVLVLNDTKVVPARLTVNKLTGGAVTILFLINEWDGGPHIKGLPDKGLMLYEGLFLDGHPMLEPISHVNEEFTFKILVAPEIFRKLFEKYGQTPLPPYIHSDLSEEELRQKYQSVFAEKPASVAAPTASLHFTDNVFKTLDVKDIIRTKVTLHVGRGTFSPVRSDQISSGELHSEPIHITKESAEIIQSAKQSGRAVTACGTTALRLLEATADYILAGKEYEGETTLFIKAPYEFKVVDIFITNFHLPGTSLLMLVDAFLKSKKAKKSWRDLYELAIRQHFRFYSFGDAMLII
ncbi:MAG: tRNA preQ1(34) S-adenosylmethionine ribosyltransferase-isomerase QueA [Candidatus Taylorbacteria bacterium]|nr:tRNA preQ1(34) S-adenosylmethionine ribosyltransferase-isomerase QueA [Candidatus Taylorbacteria bacterium]